MFLLFKKYYYIWVTGAFIVSYFSCFQNKQNKKINLDEIENKLFWAQKQACFSCFLVWRRIQPGPYLRWTISELSTKVQNQNLKIKNSKFSHSHQFCSYCNWRTIVNYHIKIDNAVTKVIKSIEGNSTMQESIDLKIYALSCVQMKLCDNQIRLATISNWKLHYSQSCISASISPSNNFGKTKIKIIDWSITSANATSKIMQLPINTSSNVSLRQARRSMQLFVLVYCTQALYITIWRDNINYAVRWAKSNDAKIA